ncbi:hypothetical protein CEUSTIGMA_g6463.t1 [Chlamydomonas eustigma]|uniref:PHD-type domain-containing protein n=1 Tax=Chlamydomonas eustigma TaxID=1157962 RepID=A0A250X7G3_9CHLO|nr:hypothetical protein CEUSTIGMA_g6463.t1 [Chlamydomonas eustigma]|eukprot:GAX79023.1 hypothetical protein CEUSTIGMA_g6463.t1 [Chlamydomonas eustigma]
MSLESCSLCHDGSTLTHLGKILGPLSGSYVHQLCALWSPEVYETEEGTLRGVLAAIRRGRQIKCTLCGKRGATIGCRVTHCGSSYHLTCAVKAKCRFYPDKYLLSCPAHAKLFRNENGSIGGDHYDYVLPCIPSLDDGIHPSQHQQQSGKIRGSTSIIGVGASKTAVSSRHGHHLRHNPHHQQRLISTGITRPATANKRLKGIEGGGSSPHDPLDHLPNNSAVSDELRDRVNAARLAVATARHEPQYTLTAKADAYHATVIARRQAEAAAAARTGHTKLWDSANLLSQLSGHLSHLRGLEDDAGHAGGVAGAAGLFAGGFTRFSDETEEEAALMVAEDDEAEFAAKEARRLKKDIIKLDPIVLCKPSARQGQITTSLRAAGSASRPADVDEDLTTAKTTNSGGTTTHNLLVSESASATSGFAAVGGLDSVVKNLKEMVLLPLLYPELMSGFGNGALSGSGGILLHGPPGTGKTLLARAVAEECAKLSPTPVTLFARKGADCLGKYAGDAERTLRLIFDEARRRAPSIIFLDELDALVPERSVRGGTGDQIYASIVSTLLALMDGVRERGHVVVIGATNRPASIDRALRRPGRFDREVLVGLPDEAGREAILKVHTWHWPSKPPPAVLKRLAAATAGYAGADLAALAAAAVVAAAKRCCPLMSTSIEDRMITTCCYKEREITSCAAAAVKDDPSVPPPEIRAAASNTANDGLLHKVILMSPGCSDALVENDEAEEGLPAGGTYEKVGVLVMEEEGGDYDKVVMEEEEDENKESMVVVMDSALHTSAPDSSLFASSLTQLTLHDVVNKFEHSEQHLKHHPDPPPVSQPPHNIHGSRTARAVAIHGSRTARAVAGGFLSALNDFNKCVLKTRSMMVTNKGGVRSASDNDIISHMKKRKRSNDLILSICQGGVDSGRRSREDHDIVNALIFRTAQPHAAGSSYYVSAGGDGYQDHDVLLPLPAVDASDPGCAATDLGGAAATDPGGSAAATALSTAGIPVAASPGDASSALAVSIHTPGAASAPRSTAALAAPAASVDIRGTAAAAAEFMDAGMTTDDGVKNHCTTATVIQDDDDLHDDDGVKNHCTTATVIQDDDDGVKNHCTTATVIQDDDDLHDDDEVKNHCTTATVIQDDDDLHDDDGIMDDDDVICRDNDHVRTAQNNDSHADAMIAAAASGVMTDAGLTTTHHYWVHQMTVRACDWRQALIQTSPPASVRDPEAILLCRSASSPAAVKRREGAAAGSSNNSLTSRRIKKVPTSFSLNPTTAPNPLFLQPTSEANAVVSSVGIITANNYNNRSTTSYSTCTNNILLTEAPLSCCHALPVLPAVHLAVQHLSTRLPVHLMPSRLASVVLSMRSGEGSTRAQPETLSSSAGADIADNNFVVAPAGSYCIKDALHSQNNGGDDNSYQPSLEPTTASRLPVNELQSYLSQQRKQQLQQFKVLKEALEQCGVIQRPSPAAHHDTVIYRQQRAVNEDMSQAAAESSDHRQDDDYDSSKHDGLRWHDEHCFESDCNASGFCNPSTSTTTLILLLPAPLPTALTTGIIDCSSLSTQHTKQADPLDPSKMCFTCSSSSSLSAHVADCCCGRPFPVTATTPPSITGFREPSAAVIADYYLFSSSATSSTLSSTHPSLSSTLLQPSTGVMIESANTVMLRLFEGAKIYPLKIPSLVLRGQGDIVEGCVSLVTEWIHASSAANCHLLVFHVPQVEHWVTSLRMHKEDKTLIRPSKAVMRGLTTSSSSAMRPSTHPPSANMKQSSVLSPKRVCNHHQPSTSPPATSSAASLHRCWSSLSSAAAAAPVVSLAAAEIAGTAGLDDEQDTEQQVAEYNDDECRQQSLRLWTMLLQTIKLKCPPSLSVIVLASSCYQPELLPPSFLSTFTCVATSVSQGAA